MKPIPVFVGYDPREAIAYHTCVNSIIRHASQPVAIIPVALNLFKDYDETHTDGSNQFIYSRFLVPHLMDYQGWAIFIDGDMILRGDIVELWNLQSPYNDVMVVKHDYKTRMTEKYLGSKNEDYPRKNWSSVILWNCNSFPNRKLTPEFVQKSTGAELHRFSWLDDERIGELPSAWNWLDVEYEWNPEAKLVHYTLGTPCFHEFADAGHFAEEWHQERLLTDHCQQTIYMEEAHASLLLDYPDMVVEDAISPPSHELDMVPPELSELFGDLIKYRVDPAGDYYGLSLQTLTEKIQALDNQTVHAVDSEYRYERKGHMFDPILQSFVQGCGGQITTWAKSQSAEVPAVLRGITKRKEMNACREAGRDFYYIDTGYFGNGKKKMYHRITRNDVQNVGPVISRPRDRLAATGWQPKKFTRGSKILLAPPSQKLLNLYDINLDTWLESVQAEINAYTDREIIVRRKQSRSVRVNQDTMEMALSDDIHCLITFSSIAATEALLFGKPAITLGPNAAQSLCSRSVSAIENLNIPSLDEVEEWAAHLAYCQFTEQDMRDGTAWRILNDH